MKKVKSVTCPKIHHNDEQRNNKALTDAKKTKRMIGAFNLEHNRCENYFDRMYRTIQFTFVAMIAIALFAFDSETNENTAIFMFYFVFPVTLYVFGILFAYNAYAITIYGKRATVILRELYPLKNKNKKPFDIDYILHIYVGTDRKVTLLSYGVPLAFYLLTPLASIIICKIKFGLSFCSLPSMFSLIVLLIYYVFMTIIIGEIARCYSIKDSN